MDTDEIGATFRCHGAALKRFLERMVGRAEAEDLLQETFERALKAKDLYRGEASAKNWIFRIASNLAVDFIRRTGRHADYVVDSGRISGDELGGKGAFADIADERPWNMPLEMAKRAEMLDCIADFINQLQPRFKTIILLREIDALSVDDISEILEISPENARVRIFRSREALKKALAKGCHIYMEREGNYACDPK